jgi:hypothetical protein
MAELTTPPIKDMTLPEPAKCGVCGEPMQPAESMFKYHGSLGPCPKPPLPRERKAMIGYTFRDEGGKFWIDIEADRSHVTSIDFDTASERDRAYDDLLAMMRSMGAQDMPSAKPQ